MTDRKRYNVVLPTALYDELKRVADKHHVPVIELLRKFIKLGLVVTALEDVPDSELIIREGEHERRIIIL